MKLLRCKICGYEADLIENEHSINRKIKCSNYKCNLATPAESKEPEIIVIRKRNVPNRD